MAAAGPEGPGGGGGLSGCGGGGGSRKRPHCRSRSRQHRMMHSASSSSKRAMAAGASSASSSSSSSSHAPRSPDSLLDICARITAETTPFQLIEERYDRIPEPVQERVIFWSFPRNERDICMYSSLSRVPTNSQEYHNSPFYRGIKILEQGCVQDVLQVGFHLSGEIRPPKTPIPQGMLDIERKYKVSVSFDRCKITSVTCSCDTRDIFWCQHVVALSLFRIRNAERVALRVPISETLLQMSRPQLQKLVQYLISEHHTDVLPTAQRLADEIMKKRRSAINLIEGAPDPTAGADAETDNSWHLDEEQVRDQVKSYLAQGGYYNANKQLGSMFAKVREMLRVRDSNGARMLTLMTDQFLSDPRLILWKSQGTPMTDKCRQLWDQLGAIWVTIVLNPTIGARDKAQLWQQLDRWTRLDVCPLEDPDQRSHPSPDASRRLRSRRRTGHNSAAAAADASSESEDDSAPPLPPAGASDSARAPLRPPILGPDPSAPSPRMLSPTSRKRSHHGYFRPRTIFHKALDAIKMNWDNRQLKLILTQDVKPSSRSSAENSFFDDDGQPLWHEHIPTACARVDALRSHGYTTEALRLAVSIVRTMKRTQLIAKSHWKQQQENILKECTPTGVAKKPGHASWEGWIGHALNPIGCLFDVLTEPGLSSEDRTRVPHFLDSTLSSSGNSNSSIGGGDGGSAGPTAQEMTLAPAPFFPVRYRHVPVPGSKCSGETYLTLAVEAAVIGLGQQRVMPPGLYAQEKACKHEERLIARLQEVEVDSLVSEALRYQASLQLDMGPSSGLGCGVHPESVPLQTFAKYFFIALLPRDPELAFRVGLRAMRMPILEGFTATAAAALENELNNAAAAAAVGADPNHHAVVPALPAVPHAHVAAAAAAASAGHSFVMSRYPRWFTLGHIEGQQCLLASAMLGAAKDDIRQLRSVLDCAQRNVHSSSHLFKLAQDAFAYALPPTPPAPPAASSSGGLTFPPANAPPREAPRPEAVARIPALLNVGFQLGLQVMRMTLTSSLNWRRREMVRWMVTCVVEVGLEAVLSIMQNWSGLFTPTEATGTVASTLMSHATIVRLNLDFTRQEELASCARTLALQCSHEDPSNCSLNALTLCENEPIAFETAYQIVIDAAESIMTSSQLFTIARYMEHRGYPHRAYKLALLAMKNVHVAYNQDAHPAINDIHWACALSHSLGKTELSALVPMVVKNVQCATVLSDLLRRCSMTTPGTGTGSKSAADKRKLQTRKDVAAATDSLSFERSPLRQLLEAAIAAFVATTHSRLSSISPRHYAEFIDFLTKARETFLLSREDGQRQFAQLVENMKVAYKGKKKLVHLIKERFG